MGLIKTDIAATVSIRRNFCRYRQIQRARFGRKDKGPDFSVRVPRILSTKLYSFLVLHEDNRFYPPSFISQSGMPRRRILTDKERSALLDLPTDEAKLLKFYTLADDDLDHIGRRRRPHNRFGFALQLCALRYPGRALAPGELIPKEVCEFLGAQLGLKADDLGNYAAREETRHEHMASLRSRYGYRSFSGRAAQDLKDWLNRQAERAEANEDLARWFVFECRRRRIILPAITSIERLCADALVAAERRLDARIADRIDESFRRTLSALLDEMIDDRISRFVWLRQFEPGNNSAVANRLLDRLEFLQSINLPEGLLQRIPPHRIARLRRQGERYFADGLRELPENRRFAILAVCVAEWQATLADAVVETHDRIVGRTYRTAQRLCEVRILNEKTATCRTLQSFVEIGGALICAQDDGTTLDDVIALRPGWDEFRDLVAVASKLTDAMADEPLNHVVHGYHRFRLYARRMLLLLDIKAAPSSKSLLTAIEIMRVSEAKGRPLSFVRRPSKWHQLLSTQPDDIRIWEIAVLFHVRNAFRSGDIWLTSSRRYADLKRVLVPPEVVANTARLAVPLRPEDWLADRRARIEAGPKRLGQAARAGTIPGGRIEDGILHIDKLPAIAPFGIEDLVLDLYKRIPDTRITTILSDVDSATGFSETFTHLRTGAPCKDRIGLLNVILSEGVNLGLRKMAEATDSHGYWELMRIARWHVEGASYNRALATVVEAQAKLPMATFWGMGTAASSDGQFFPAAEKGEAMNMVNARYGHEPGLKAYTHVSDQFAPFATQTIPATVSEAPYILDGLLMNETGRRIETQYADTGGVSDHIFAVCSILGYAFVPRISGLSSRRLYSFDPTTAPMEVRPLIGGKIRERLIVPNWPDILRIAETMAAGKIRPSQILKKLASYPRQNELALAMREIGRVERTLFTINWVLDANMQRSAQTGLNKGEAHHALKRALNFYRHGEIRDRTSEGQHYRIAGLNLLVAIVIYWNTVKLGEAVTKRRQAGLPVPPEMLAHTSPLGWAHIILTGEYRWPKA